MSLKIFILLILISPIAFCQDKQVGIGQWRTHFSYNSATSLTLADENKVYSASPSSLFFTIEDGFKTLSKIDGLSEIGVSVVEYSPELEILIIAYNSGNIDIVKNGEIININDIYRKVIQGSKQINHIHFYKNFAYLSCDFGLVLIDCQKLEIKETYSNLSADGSVPRVIASTTLQDSLFVATEKGVISAPIKDGINLLDIKSWQTLPQPIASKFTKIIGICTLQGRIYAASDPEGAFYLNNSNWTLLTAFVNRPTSLNFITPTKDKIILGGINNIFTVTPDFQVTRLAASTPNPMDALFDNDGVLWVADKDLGLHTNKYSTIDNLKVFTPNGPYSPSTWSLSYFNGKIIGVPGGYSSNGATSNSIGGFYVFENQKWESFIIGNKFPVPAINFVDSYYNAFDKKVYFASLGGGVITLNPDSTYDKYDNKNTTLTEAYTDHPYVSSIEADTKGNLWVVNSFVAFANYPSLHVMNTAKNWSAVKTFNLEPYRYLTGLVIDNSNYKWMHVIPEVSSGLLVYDSDKDRFRALSTGVGLGGLPSNKVYALAKDQTGQIWVGTDKGVAIFYEPSRVFSSTGSDASQPKVNGFGLLFDQVITAIEVDGGNRKWIGTRNGLWLFNPDGTQAIEHFTVDNSPLISNEIKDIETNDLTGEVFISTTLGLISYRGSSTLGSDEFSTVKIFPNPVSPGFSGTIGITGLTENAYVKITDMYGNLVYDTKAQGGMATWNQKNYNGVQSKSGLYLVFSMSKDGQEKMVSKFTIVQ